MIKRLNIYDPEGIQITKDWGFRSSFRSFRFLGEFLFGMLTVRTGPLLKYLYDRSFDILPKLAVKFLDGIPKILSPSQPLLLISPFPLLRFPLLCFPALA